MKIIFSENYLALKKICEPLEIDLEHLETYAGQVYQTFQELQIGIPIFAY